MRSHLFFVPLLAGILSAGATHVARAQICPGSHLNLIVRDAKGATIENAWPGDLHFEGDGKSGAYKWDSEKLTLSRTADGLPPEIAKLDGKGWSLSATAWCVFETDVKLWLTLKGRTMSLLFRMPKLGKYESRDFIVDSLKFQEGSYEILLTLPTDSPRGNFFPARAWKKVGDKAEPLPPKSP